jgi:DNA helicase-2/ATP-dependent DNA helicase PcrA
MVVMNLVMSRLWTFLLNSFIIHITSTLPAQSFRIQSIRPFVAKNVNSVRLDMTDEFSSLKYSGPLVTQPDKFQKDAVICTDHAVMIVAGPGSGKTRVMAARLAHLLQSGNCSPKECLVISFTSSAATNLLEKTKDLLKKSESVATTVGVYCDTFHGFCSTVIKENVDSVMGSKKGFNIASDDEQTKIMTEIMELKGLNAPKAEVKNILTQIRYWKECGLGYVGIRKNTLGTHIEKRAYNLYPDYQRKLMSGSFLDFGDLLLSTLRLFRENTEVLDKYRSRFRHVLIDEFQDVSPAQYDILRILVLGSTNAGENKADDYK